MVLQVHVLPREMLGKSTFGLSMWLLKWFPIRIVDGFLLMVSWLMLGDTAKLGLDRPRLGPLQLKNISGKTPVLDVGTLAKIKAGHIKVLSLSSHFYIIERSQVTTIFFIYLIIPCFLTKSWQEIFHHFVSSIKFWLKERGLDFF